MESEYKSSNLVLPVIIGIVITILVVAFLGKHYIDQEQMKKSESYEHNMSIIEEHKRANQEQIKKNESELYMINSFARVMSEYEKDGYY